MNSDRLDLIETFLCIAQSDSLSQAAGKLHTTQATISRKLKKLEELLQQALISRTTHSLCLTEAGKEILNDAQTLIDQWQKLESRYKNEKTKSSDALYIATPLFMQLPLIQEITSDFQQIHPNIKMNVVASDIQDDQLYGDYDVQFLFGDHGDRTQQSYAIANCEQAIVCTPELAKGRAFDTPDHLEKLPYIGLQSAEGSGLTITSKSNQEAQSIYPRNQKLTQDRQALYEAVCDGSGVGVLPLCCISELLRTNKLVDVAPQWKPSSLAINARFTAGSSTHHRAYAFVFYLSTRLKKIPGIHANLAGTTGS